MIEFRVVLRQIQQIIANKTRGLINYPECHSLNRTSVSLLLLECATARQLELSE